MSSENGVEIRRFLRSLGECEPAERNSILDQARDSRSSLQPIAEALLHSDPITGFRQIDSSRMQWERMEQIFQDALELDPGRRVIFLEEACVGDRTLQRRLEALLAAAEKPSVAFSEWVDISLNERAEEQKTADAVAFLQPLQNWDRYEILELIGEGGMGRVYKARDRRLNRIVALKFIRGDSPELSLRFAQEARAQARVEHDSICKIYEVGEVNHLSYIAMQFVNGVSLQHAAPRMSLEQKVRVILQSAEAVHAAHRIGLIHRDIKPANIIVEAGEDQDFRPYITDFGIAREMHAEGQTVTGMILGTPAYMSPEQARGEVHKLDRRTDVYSLGATLYELIAGAPPFASYSGLDIVLKVLEEEPVMLSRLHRSVPRDLETIVMKCLEKDPVRRYESAKALAQDLSRFLDGETILARPAGYIHRAYKKAKKHKRAVAVVGITAFLAMGFAVAGLQAKMTARTQVRLAADFGRQVQEMESILRYAYSMPLHDIRKEREIVRKKMQSLQGRMKTLGNVAVGPGNYALGRGYLALGEWDEARERLEDAWKSGYREEAVAQALGLALAAMYEKALTEAINVKNKELREKETAEVERKYRDPALGYLKGIRGGESLLYIEGLIAFYEKRYDEAISKAQEFLKGHPWFYESKKLEGDVYRTSATAKYRAGDYNGALDEFSKAESSYRQAMEMARSDPALYEAECRRRNTLLEMSVDRGVFSQEHFDKALAACNQALAANVEDPDPYHGKSLAHWHLANFEMAGAKDPRQTFREASELARETIKRDPLHRHAWISVCGASVRIAEYELRNGLDPTESLRRSMEVCAEGVRKIPSYSLYTNLSVAYLNHAEYQHNSGSDPRNSCRDAIRYCEKALQIYPDHHTAWNNRGNANLRIARYEMETGLDAGSSVQNALESWDKAIQANPGYFPPYINTGILCNTQAQHALRSGRFEESLIRKAIERCEKSLEINSNFPATYTVIGEAHLVRLEFEVLSGIDPHDSTVHAMEAFRRARDLRPNDAAALSGLGEVYRLNAVHKLHKGDDPTSDLKQAMKYFRQLQHANLSGVYWSQARVNLLWAESALRKRRSPEPHLTHARSLLEKALRLDEHDTDILAGLAECFRQEAEWGLQRGNREIDLIEQGLKTVERALAVNSNLPEVTAIRGALLLLRSRCEVDESHRKQSTSLAVESIRKALRMNPLLRRRYGSILSEAEKQ